MEFKYCSTAGKLMFPSIGEAKGVLTKPGNAPHFDGKRVKRRMNKRNETRAYFCEHCRHYHLTSSVHYKKKRK